MEVVKDTANGKCAVNMRDCISVTVKPISPYYMLHICTLDTIKRYMNDESRISNKFKVSHVYQYIGNKEGRRGNRDILIRGFLLFEHFVCFLIFVLRSSLALLLRLA